MSEKLRTSGIAAWLLCIFGVLLVLVGLSLGVGGVLLVWEGGSPYYLVAGLGCIAAGILYIRHSTAGFVIYGVVFLLTIVWSYWETGLEFWPLVARILAPAVLALFALLLVPVTSSSRMRIGLSRAGAVVVLIAIVATAVSAFQPHGVIKPSTAVALRTVTADGQEWRSYGRTGAADRFIASGQINKSNVAQLELAWTAHTGTPAKAGPVDSNTPIQVGDTIYYCNPFNKIIALNGDTGKERWVYEAHGKEEGWPRCRAVAYYDSPVQDGPCADRIVMSTNDARLVEVDAQTGELCHQFGNGGILDLWTGMGERHPGYYFQTSQPTVTHGLIILGGYVIDNVSVGEPSGVVRAFNAETGALVWAWDLGNPNNTREAPPEGYTPGTPNVWSAMAVDEERGLVYLPIGNATPDYWGGERTEAADTFSTSVVALNVSSGRPAWHYQIVRHDLWDYDLASQPSLYDWPDGNGGRVPAVIQMTKHGMIYVLNRETGKPLINVEDKPVAIGKAQGEHYAGTQPFATGMPMIGNQTLTESDMWGITPIDQMIRRIAFRQMKYDGLFTPPDPQKATLEWPGSYGGMNWGGMTIDPVRDYMIFNDIRVGQRMELISRDRADQMVQTGGHAAFASQHGTPYGVLKPNFMLVLGVPCQKPPFGTLTAVDMKTRQIAWQVPMGTVQDTSPLGITTGLPIPIGMPTLGGPVSTGGGVTFYAGTQDFYLRAIDSDTGDEIWKYRMPVGNNATPMIYVSPKTGDEFVIVVAGGSRESKSVGDYILAFRIKYR